MFSKVERAELEHPSPHKVLPDRVIYRSYTVPITHGAPVISDFGAARLGEPGQKHSGDVMPGVYRAPEIIAGMEWDDKIDIWSVGVMVCKQGKLTITPLGFISNWKYMVQIWDLLEGGSLFRPVKEGHLDDEQHFAEMVALLGPPPKAFLERSDKCLQFWDPEGKCVSVCWG